MSHSNILDGDEVGILSVVTWADNLYSRNSTVLNFSTVCHLTVIDNRVIATFGYNTVSPTSPYGDQ